MRERPIRKMNREELLEMLIQYTEINEKLEARIAQLENKLTETEKRLEERTIAIANAGSIAEAAMQLNGVFDAAQKAADQYLQSIRFMFPADRANAASPEMQHQRQTMSVTEQDENGYINRPQSSQGTTRRRNRGMDR